MQMERNVIAHNGSLAGKSSGLGGDHKVNCFKQRKEYWILFPLSGFEVEDKNETFLLGFLCETKLVGIKMACRY